MPYRVSAGYTHQNGILENDHFQRTTLGFLQHPSLHDNHLTIGLMANGTYISNKFADNGAIGAAFSSTQQNQF